MGSFDSACDGISKITLTLRFCWKSTLLEVAKVEVFRAGSRSRQVKNQELEPQNIANVVQTISSIASLRDVWSVQQTLIPNKHAATVDAKPVVGQCP